MNRLFPTCVFALFAAGAAQGAPLCHEFLSADTMPKKYAKLAPVLSGAEADWIITADQMDVDYAPTAEAAGLLSQIAEAFEARGTRLAIVMAPPRPLIAGQSAVDALAGAGAGAGYDVEAVSASFNQMIDVVRGAGAIAPNLLELATGDPELRDGFYYRHDTHWTPRGAAESAVALAQAVLDSDIAAFADTKVVRPELQTEDIFSERGSLADMAKAVCGAQIAPVDLAIPAFPQTGDMSLLGDSASRPRVILAGSSFSNRYKKDAYRVADAISGALQADVINYSVSGGGAIGAIEGVVNKGLLDEGAPVDLVVWELPYTEGLNNLGALRQLLGALQFDHGKPAVAAAELDASGKTKIKLKAETSEVLALHLPDATLQRIKVDLKFDDGSKETLSLVRKNRVPPALQSDWWAFSLAGLEGQGLASVAIRYKGSDLGASAEAQVF